MYILASQIGLGGLLSVKEREEDIKIGEVGERMHLGGDGVRVEINILKVCFMRV